MTKDIYYIAAKNLMRWSPDERLDVLDRLAPSERRRVCDSFEKMIAEEECRSISLMALTHFLSSCVRHITA